MPASAKKSQDTSRKLYKSRKDKMIDGVCSGIAEYFHIDVSIVRVLWLISAFLNGIGVAAYIIAMIFIPVNPDHKNLKDEEIRETNPALIWGSALIILGIIFFFNRWHGFHLYHFPHWDITWWHMPWDFWPIALIILGILYIIHVLTKDKKQLDASAVKADDSASKRLARSKNDRILAGICGGLGHYWQIDPVLIRIGVAILALMTSVFALLIVYAVLIFILPNDE